MLWRLLLLCGWPLLGLYGSPAGAFDLRACLAFWVLTSFGLGALLGAGNRRLGPPFLVLGSSMSAALLVGLDLGPAEQRARVDGAGVWLALLGCVALWSVGAALGRRLPRHSRSTAILGSLLLLSLSALPTRALLFRQPLAQGQPKWAALCMDLSPIGLVHELAGFDWMRHPSVYAAAGTDFFSDRRQPWRPTLALVLVLVLGCLPALWPARAQPGRPSR